MVRKLGRFLQLAGLLILPAGMAGNMVDPQRVGVWPMLTIAAVGLVVFTIGWYLQQVGGAK